MLLVSRATLELYVRRRVLAIPNVSLEQGVQVDELLADGRKIVGASLADSESDQVREIFADLIVDASGRSSIVATIFNRSSTSLRCLMDFLMLLANDPVEPTS